MNYNGKSAEYLNALRENQYDLTEEFCRIPLLRVFTFDNTSDVNYDDTCRLSKKFFQAYPLSRVRNILRRYDIDGRTGDIKTEIEQIKDEEDKLLIKFYFKGRGIKWA